MYQDSFDYWILEFCLRSRDTGCSIFIGALDGSDFFLPFYRMKSEKVCDEDVRGCHQSSIRPNFFSRPCRFIVNYEKCTLIGFSWVPHDRVWRTFNFANADPSLMIRITSRYWHQFVRVFVLSRVFRVYFTRKRTPVGSHSFSDREKAN